VAETETTPEHVGWAILELMGHRKLAGYVSEQQVAGHGFVRIDIFAGPAPEEGDEPAVATQMYSPGAVYCITPTTEDLARQLGERYKPAPVARYELPPVAASARGFDADDDDELDDGPGF
jgi:hypothetical protein